MDKGVQVISVSTVLPATYQPSAVPRRIDITPWDLQCLQVSPNERGLVFSVDVVPDIIQRLKQSLSRALDFFYPLAGRLSSIKNVSNDSSLFYIECNNAGVEFIHAVADDVTMADLLHPVYDPSIMRMLFSLSENKDDSKPFLAVQVTEFSNGGFFLGCTLSHVFCDGSSFWHFLNSWSEICRGSDSPKNLPVLVRDYPGRTDIWIPNELIGKPPLIQERIASAIHKERIFNFPKDKLALLKQNAIKETGIQSISTHVLLITWATQCLQLSHS